MMGGLWTLASYVATLVLLRVTPPDPAEPAPFLKNIKDEKTSNTRYGGAQFLFWVSTTNTSQHS